MIDRHSISEARRNLPTLMREAETGKPVELARHGKPVAVLIAYPLFERLTANRRGFAKAYRSFLKDFNIRKLSLNPDELFEDVREEVPGRSVHL